MLGNKDIAAKARDAIEKANNETLYGSYNDGYFHGYADALKEVAQLKYYAISADGATWTWQWLTDEEAEQERLAGKTVKAN